MKPLTMRSMSPLAFGLSLSPHSLSFPGTFPQAYDALVLGNKGSLEGVMGVLDGFVRDRDRAVAKRAMKGELQLDLPQGMTNPLFLTLPSFDEKREMLMDAQLSKLIVVADFDATLTTGDSEQCHDLVGFSNLMSQAFRDEFAPLLDWQSNAAIDGVEWWHTAHSLMVKHGMPLRNLLPRLVRQARMFPRPGLLKLLARLATLQVPLLIVSAGLSDIIEEFLRLHGALTENITVCSNRLNYGADNTPASVSPEQPITSFTKTTAYSASASFFREHSDRTTVLVMGDSAHDIDSAAHIPNANVLSVGFLNGKKKVDAAAHEKAFDALVLGNGGSLEGVDRLLEDMGSSLGRGMGKVPSMYFSMHKDDASPKGVAWPSNVVAWP